MDIEGAKIEIDGEAIEFNAPIGDEAEFEEVVVIRLEANLDEYPDRNRNVIGISKDGSISWKIPARPEYDPRQYSGMWTDEDGNLWAFNFDGWAYQIDPSTGAILDKEFHR